MDETRDRIEELYRLHGQAIAGYLRRLCGPGETPDDLLHETFVQAIRCDDALARAASPRAWLFGVARNVGLNARRRQQHIDSLPQDVPGPAELAGDPRLEPMRKAITALPDIQRETLTLRLTDELSYEEIAAVIKVPVGTVRSRLHNAVRRLRETLLADNENENRQ